ncbi:hypothetical protein WJX73_004910 [Symbiochloris irregularis]|uniref:F-box domain-containing protein n=1 Tax=Symbiochloris irregularis TaxID=706552 RepID=A0AAW1NMY2_9CHLO
MQNNSGVPDPDWGSLPPELLVKVFKELQLQDQVRSELCCKAWHRLLSRPQVPDLWGPVTIELDKLPKRSRRPNHAANEREFDLASLSPICRWLRARLDLRRRLSRGCMDVHAELSALTDLTRLALKNYDEAMSAVASAINLQQLYLKRSITSDPEWASCALQRLARLQLVSLCRLQLRPETLQKMQELPSLTTLLLANLFSYSMDHFPNGAAGACQAMGRLTRLTRLEIEDCNWEGFEPSKLQDLHQLQILRGALLG